MTYSTSLAFVSKTSVAEAIPFFGVMIPIHRRNDLCATSFEDRLVGTFLIVILAAEENTLHPLLKVAIITTT